MHVGQYLENLLPSSWLHDPFYSSRSIHHVQKPSDIILALKQKLHGKNTQGNGTRPTHMGRPHIFNKRTHTWRDPPLPFYYINPFSFGNKRTENRYKFYLAWKKGRENANEGPDFEKLCSNFSHGLSRILQKWDESFCRPNWKQSIILILAKSLLRSVPFFLSLSLVSLFLLTFLSNYHLPNRFAWKRKRAVFESTL